MWSQNTISVHQPGFYAQRFQQFVTGAVFKKYNPQSTEYSRDFLSCNAVHSSGILCINTLTTSAILGQTRLPWLNPKSQLSKNKVHL